MERLRKLDQNKLTAISEACAKDLGFENNQFVSIFYKDTEHPHMHVIANRIGFDKKTVSDSNNYQKTASFFRKMELKFNLRQVLKYKHQTGLFIHRLKVK